MNASDEEYGEERIKEQMTSPAANITSVLDDVQTFINGSPVSDDMTVVMIKSEG